MGLFSKRRRLMFRSSFPLMFLLSGLTLLLSNCQKVEEEPEAGTFGYVYKKTLKNACIECHVPSGAATQLYGVTLDFTTQTNAFQTLRASNVSGQSSIGTCGGIKIVAPGAPQNSYLVGVLISDYNANGFAGVTGCTPYTAHLADQNLSVDEKNSILTWIQKGAPND